MGGGGGGGWKTGRVEGQLHWAKKRQRAARMLVRRRAEQLQAVRERCMQLAACEWGASQSGEWVQGWSSRGAYSGGRSTGTAIPGLTLQLGLNENALDMRREGAEHALLLLLLLLLPAVLLLPSALDAL